jgi:hypothetical protein
MAITFTAPLAPRFQQILAFDCTTKADRWYVTYMKLDQGRWSWASKGVMGTKDEVRTAWRTSLMSPMDRAQGFRVADHATPPREWDICADDDVSREWVVLIQRIERGTVETVQPCVFSFVGNLVQLRTQYPRSIFWPAK